MRDPQSEENQEEVVLQGIGVSPGVAVAPAFVLPAIGEEVVKERTIAEDEVADEIMRLEESLIETRRQLHEIQRKVGQSIGDESASIFDAHLMVVDDRAFMEEVIRELKDSRRAVDFVLHQVSGRYADVLAAMEDDYLRERAADVRDVTRRIIRNMKGEGGLSLEHLDSRRLVVAHDLSPSESAVLDKEKVIGFVTDLGGRTSHTAIVARGLGIPAVVGMHDLSASARDDDLVLIDGSKGVVILRPTQASLDAYGKLAKERATIRSSLDALREEPAETADGYNIALSANIKLPSDLDAVLQSGARGVGLFRTEFLYLTEQGLPGEDEQARVYSEVAERLHPDPLIIRTMDLGGDKVADAALASEEMNPFLGWRAIRYCLAQPEFFKTQLRAVLRASVHENVQLMYPMICNVEEVDAANALLEEAKEELRAKGIPFNDDMDVGVMMEVPSAALTADMIAPRVDFFSIGTNDLVQYTMAVDRVNERIAHLYEPTNPAIIRLIRQIVEAAHANKIWVGACGEMAGDPLMVPLLLGLGVDELSVSPARVPLVKDVIVKMTLTQAEELAAVALESETGAAAREACLDLVRRTAPEVLELI